MIAPMKKVSLVILDREKESALKALRKAGLVHLEPVEGKGEKLAALKNDYAKLQSAAGYLGEIKLPKKTVYPELSQEEAVKKAQLAIDLTERKKSLLEKIAASDTEIDRLSAWGTVNPADFAYLSEKGVHLSMYEVPNDKWRLIGEDVKALLVNSSKSGKRFLVLSDSPETERPAGLPPEAYAVVMPEKSTEEIAADIKAYEAETAQIEKDLAVAKSLQAKEVNKLSEIYGELDEERDVKAHKMAEERLQQYKRLIYDYE